MSTATKFDSYLSVGVALQQRIFTEVYFCAVTSVFDNYIAAAIKANPLAVYC